MKKFIAIAAAAGALAFGSAASAQDLGGILGSIFGQGTYPDYPAVITHVPPGTRIYQDQHGRQFYRDANGRRVYVQQRHSGITGHDAWGRPIYGPPLAGYPLTDYTDRDGDGVSDLRDRWPQDPTQY